MKPNRDHGMTDMERARMCTGKVRYSDELTATAGAMISLEQHNNGYSKLWTYRCPECHGFHVTKKKQFGKEPVTLELLAA